jgi:2Fe-2S ferredoxin
MAKIIYIEHNGTEHSVDVEQDYSVMEGAINNGIPGIDADCGGQCACATCHVFVDAAWQDQVGTPSEMERSMLEFVDGLSPQSRLACQIKVSPELDGLIVRLPKSQH